MDSPIALKGNHVLELPQTWVKYGPCHVAGTEPKDLEKAMAANWRAKVERRLPRHHAAHRIAYALAGFWTLDSYQSWQGRATLVEFTKATRRGVDAAIATMVAARVLTQVRLYRLNGAGKAHPVGTVWLPTDPDTLDLVPPEMIARDMSDSPIRPGDTVDVLVESAPLPHAPNHVRVIRTLNPDERAAIVQCGRPKPAASGRKSKAQPPETISGGGREMVSGGVAKPFPEGGETISGGVRKPFPLKDNERDEIPGREFEEGEPGTVASLPAGHGVLDSRPEKGSGNQPGLNSEAHSAGSEWEPAPPVPSSSYPPPAAPPAGIVRLADFRPLDESAHRAPDSTPIPAGRTSEPPAAPCGDFLAAAANTLPPVSDDPAALLMRLLPPPMDLYGLIDITNLSGRTYPELEAFVMQYQGFGESYGKHAAKAVLRELSKRKSVSIAA